MQGKILGRPAGSKDSKQRRKSRYILRQAKEKKAVNDANGNFQPIESYLD